MTSRNKNQVNPTTEMQSASMRFREARLAQLKNAYRGWKIELIPGYKADGKLQYAHFCWKKNGLKRLLHD
jgi:hypothetical protein